jgi:hypothetical protein
MRKSFSVNLAAGAIGLMAATTFADIKVNDQLSLSGFLDMSAYETNDGPITGAIDQFEIDFLFKFNDKISARVDLAQGGVGGGAPTNLASGETVSASLALEQGFITYTEGAASLFVGKFLSATGFESAEPTGLYQYSASVYCDGVGQAVPCVYGGYQNGVALSYSLSPMLSVYGAVVGSTAGIPSTGVDPAGSTSLKDPAVEVQVSLMPVEGVTVKAAYLYDAFAGAPEAYNLANVWASYAKGPITVGAEFNYFMNFTAVDDNGTSWLAMANYKLTDKIAATARVSAIASDLGEDETGITFSPSYSVNGNWLIVTEVSRLLDAEVTTFALESLVMF